MASNEDRYLLERHGRWHYNRRTPLRYRDVEIRKFIRYSLKTKSLEIARMRRDALETADNNLWQALLLEQSERGSLSKTSRAIQEKKHKSAAARAISLGFVYMATEDLAVKGDTEDILHRLNVLESRSGQSEVAPEVEADALLGAIDKPNMKKTKVSEAFMSTAE